MKMRTFIWPKIGGICLLARIAGMAQRLHIVLGVGATEFDRLYVVYRYRLRSTRQASVAVKRNDFVPLGVRQPVSFYSCLPKPLVSPSQNRIGQSVCLGGSFFLRSVSHVVISTQLFSLLRVLRLPFLKIARHLNSMRLLVRPRLVPATRFALRVIAASGFLFIETRVQPQAVAFATGVNQNNTASA